MLAFGNHAFDDGVGVLLDDAERHAERREIFRQHVFRKIRLLLIEVDRDQLEAYRRAALKATSGRSSSVYESLPPDRQTITRSPSSIMR